ncbi:hypothetical protein ACWCQL_25070 [Streptomyces sp. NPDC002073]
MTCADDTTTAYAHPGRDAAEQLIASALVDFDCYPGLEPVLELTAGLIQYGDTARVAMAALPAAQPAAEDWDQLLSSGPGPGVTAAWTYCQALARTLRTFHDMLDTSTGGHPVTFVGREALPPIAPGTGMAPRA